MTHNFLRDKDYVRSLLSSALHPRDARAGRANGAPADQLREEGVDISEDDRARIRGPARTRPRRRGREEIAAAIVAEIVAVKRGRGAGFLRDRRGPIHERHRPVTPEPARSGAARRRPGAAEQMEIENEFDVPAPSTMSGRTSWTWSAWRRACPAPSSWRVVDDHLEGQGQHEARAGLARVRPERSRCRRS